MSEQRRLIVGCLGAEQVGKTTLVKWLYGMRMQQRHRVAIIDPGGKLGGVMPDDVPAYLEARVKARDTHSFVLDDIEAYAPRNFAPRTVWMDLATRNAHIGPGGGQVNVFWTGHRPQDVAPTLRGMTSILYLFQIGTGDRRQREALDDIAPGVVIPTEPFRFVEFWPKRANHAREGFDAPLTGRTLPGGGVVFDVPELRNHSARASASAKRRSP